MNTSSLPKFSELSDTQKQPFLELAEEILYGLHYCTRTWSAWNYGTMDESDFIEAQTDSNLVFEKAELIYNFYIT